MTIDSPENSAFTTQPPPPQAEFPTPSPVAPVRPDSPMANGFELAAIAVVGLLANFALRAFAVDSILSVGVFVVLMALMLRRSASRGSHLVVFGAAALLLPWYVLRSDPALLFINTVMVLVLLAVGAGYSLKGDAFDTSVRRNIAHTVAMGLEWAFGLSMGFRWLKKAGESRTAGPVMRGALIAAPILLIFAVLLASADEVFAGLLLFTDFGSALSHLVLAGALAVLAFGYVSRAAHETKAPTSTFNLRMLGPIEVSIILGSLTLLFAAFTITQFVVALGGAATVLEAEGLTQAEHAREGFFELLFAAGLAGLVVGAVRAFRTIPELTAIEDGSDADEDDHDEAVTTARGRDWFTPFAVTTLSLTIALAAFSLQRFILYVGSFGLTLDRVWAIATVITIIGLLALYIADIVGFRNGTSWYPTTSLLGVAALILVLNIINPGARVAEYNMTRADAIDLDVYTLTGLPDDAIPEVLSNLGTLTSDDRSDITNELCRRSDRATTYGFVEYNRASVRADNALDDLCGQRQAIQQDFFGGGGD